nr:hypothetical protein [Ancylobacter amanitiformis]
MRDELLNETHVLGAEPGQSGPGQVAARL